MLTMHFWLTYTTGSGRACHGDVTSPGDIAVDQWWYSPSLHVLASITEECTHEVVHTAQITASDSDLFVHCILVDGHDHG